MFELMEYQSDLFDNQDFDLDETDFSQRERSNSFIDLLSDSDLIMDSKIPSDIL